MLERVARLMGATTDEVQKFINSGVLVVGKDGSVHLPAHVARMRQVQAAYRAKQLDTDE